MSYETEAEHIITSEGGADITLRHYQDGGAHMICLDTGGNPGSRVGDRLLTPKTALDLIDGLYRYMQEATAKEEKT